MNKRDSKKTLEQLEKIKKTNNPYQALVQIIKLYEKFPSHETNVPVEYDQRTGKPVKYEWREVKPFQEDYGGKQVIYLFHNLSVHYFELQKNVESFLEELYDQCPLVMSTENGTYVLEQFESSTGPDTIRPTGISFHKLEKELTSQGTVGDLEEGRCLEERIE